MKINLLRGSFTYGAVTIFSRIAAVILIPILTRLMTPDEYGALNMALTIVTLVTLVVTLEVAQAVTLYFTDRNRTDRDLYPGTAFRFYLAMYLLYLAIAFLFGPMIFKMITGEDIGNAIVINAALLLATNGIFFLIQNQLRLEFKTREYAALTFGYVLLISSGAIIGAMISDRPAEAVILGQATGAAVIDIIAVAMLWRRFSSGFSFKKLREMLRFSLALVPSGLLLLGGQQVPKFILGMYGDLEDVGIYGLAYQIAGFSALAVLGVQTAITPSVLANHEEAGTPKMLGKLFEGFTIVALLLCSFLSIFAHELVMVFSTSSYARAAHFVPFLAFAIALNNLYIFFPGKIIRGKSAAQLVASAGSFVVALAAGLVFIKLDGLRGATVATLLAAATFFFIWCYISQRLYHLPVNWLKLFLAIVLTAAVCAIGIILVPPGITFKIVFIKCGLLILFACSIGWNYISAWWKRYLG
ncbi:MAG TPA: lipopolysaccharide biosynthesis protein [Ferruginibacter sp.]|nr:lipopolysaccharide biosynthesis protein [Ferruginibacter sp.]